MQTKKRLLTLFALMALTFVLGGLMIQGQKQVVAEVSAEAPILWGISDAVKPNETVTLTGYNLYADDLLVAYAPWDENEPDVFDESADVNLVNLMKALYLYNQAAVEYFV